MHSGKNSLRRIVVKRSAGIVELPRNGYSAGCSFRSTKTCSAAFTEMVEIDGAEAREAVLARDFVGSLSVKEDGVSQQANTSTDAPCELGTEG